MIEVLQVQVKESGCYSHVYPSWGREGEGPQHLTSASGSRRCYALGLGAFIGRGVVKTLWGRSEEGRAESCLIGTVNVLVVF